MLSLELLGFCSLAAKCALLAAAACDAKDADPSDADAGTGGTPDVINGPAVLPLVHYELCVLPNGNLGVKKATLVDPSTRLVV